MEGEAPKNKRDQVEEWLYHPLGEIPPSHSSPAEELNWTYSFGREEKERTKENLAQEFRAPQCRDLTWVLALGLSAVVPPLASCTSIRLESTPKHWDTSW